MNYPAKKSSFSLDGQMNNVDSRDGFSLAGKTVSLVTASNRTDNSIAIYKVNAETRRLENAAAEKIENRRSLWLLHVQEQDRRRFTTW